MSPRSRRTLLSAALLCVIALSVGAQSTTQQEDNTLTAAIAAGKVTAQFTGTGSSSGDAVRVTVQKTAAAGPATLTLTIPPGTLLRSSNPSEQNMVIAGIRGRQLDAQRFTPQSQIILTGTAAVTYVLEAYCADFHKGNPSASTGFTLTAPDPRLSTILSEGKKRNLSTRALQAAVWIATDSATYDQTNARFPIGQADWQAGRSIIEGGQPSDSPEPIVASQDVFVEMRFSHGEIRGYYRPSTFLLEVLRTLGEDGFRVVLDRRLQEHVLRNKPPLADEEEYVLKECGMGISYADAENYTTAPMIRFDVTWVKSPGYVGVDKYGFSRFGGLVFTDSFTDSPNVLVTCKENGKTVWTKQFAPRFPDRASGLDEVSLRAQDDLFDFLRILEPGCLASALGPSGPLAISTKPRPPKGDPAAKRTAIPPLLEGTNPNGDVILWDSGKTWKGVTVTGLERKSTGTLLTIKDTPAGFRAGKYRDFKEVALRGAQLPAPPIQNPIDAARLYSPGYSPQSATNLGPFASYDDTFFTKWWGVTQWDSLAVKPENAAPVQYQDGVKVLAQFRVTITHVVVKDGNCYLLVRRNAGQMLPEGWYYNIDEAIFQRESPGTKR
jgi:hypothetical protein